MSYPCFDLFPYTLTLFFYTVQSKQYQSNWRWLNTSFFPPADLREQRGGTQRLYQSGERKEERLCAVRRPGNHLRRKLSEKWRERERRWEKEGGKGGSAAWRSEEEETELTAWPEGKHWGSSPHQRVGVWMWRWCWFCQWGLCRLPHSLSTQRCWHTEAGELSFTGFYLIYGADVCGFFFSFLLRRLYYATSCLFSERGTAGWLFKPKKTKQTLNTVIIFQGFSTYNGIPPPTDSLVSHAFTLRSKQKVFKLLIQSSPR